MLTYAGGTSNLIHQLEAKLPVEYNKVKDGEMEEGDKPAIFRSWSKHEKVFISP